ncbi:MAG: DUF3965 domain-containing protein [Ectobacillus sp.]
MKVLHQEPNWGLVTDFYKEPKSFADLLSLLVPKNLAETQDHHTLLIWKKNEFYKKENLIAFIQYGIEKIAELPKFHKDEIPAILRIVHLCQEAGWYDKAYGLMEEHSLIQLVHTSIEQEDWDELTKAVSWNYLILKQKIARLEPIDSLIWDKIKFDIGWSKTSQIFISQKEILEFMFIYLCRQAKHMEKQQLENELMQLSIYCNTYIYEIYKRNLVEKYEKCISFLENYPLNPAVFACHRAVLAQISDMFHVSYIYNTEDFLVEVRRIIEHMDFYFMNTYKEFIGTLLSYIPFFEIIQVPQQVYYFEEIMYTCKGIGYKEELLRNYVFSQMILRFDSFIRPFLAQKHYASIHEILFYWCAPNERERLEEMYNVNEIYEQYACG